MAIDRTGRPELLIASSYRPRNDTTRHKVCFAWIVILKPLAEESHSCEQPPWGAIVMLRRSRNISKKSAYRHCERSNQTCWDSMTFDCRAFLRTLAMTLEFFYDSTCFLEVRLQSHLFIILYMWLKPHPRCD